MANTPSSPWATRFPSDGTIFRIGDTKHSLLAPRCPRIDDPKYYDQEPDEEKDHHPRSYKEIDSLLWGERVQRRTFWGARTFQLAAINRRLMFSTNTGLVTVASGHRHSLGDRVKALLHIPPKKPAASPKEEPDQFQIYRRERIRVDPKNWFPFLRKDRWFDWIQFSPDDAVSEPDRTWSVDDAKIWDYLSLRTMMYGRIDYWSNFEDIFGEPPTEDAAVILSHAMEVLISETRGSNTVEFEQTVTATVEESEARLNKLLSTIIWGFEDNSNVHAMTRPEPGVGESETPYSSIITINIEKLKVLLNPDLTLGEICQMQIELTVTIVHELMHAINYARCTDDEYVGNLLDEDRSGRIPKDEPYLDADGFAEAGFFMEQVFFGGLCTTLPTSYDRSQPPPPLLQVLREWPSANQASSFVPAGEDKPFMKDGALTTIFHVPTTWPSKLLTDSFWNDPAFAKSDDFFQNGRVFVMQAPIQNRHTTQCGAPRVRRIPNKPGQPENEQVADDYRFQMGHWRKLRAVWYKKALDTWDVSPWSCIKERRCIDSFAKAFAKKDAIECANMADFMVYQIDWTRDHDRYMEYMPTKDDPSFEWIWHAVGLLMLASIPIRKRKTAKAKPKMLDYNIEFSPSQEAAAAGHDNMVYIRPDCGPSIEVIADASELFVQTRPTGGGKVENFTQLSYLELIDDMIELITRLRGAVFEKFLDAIKDAKAALLQDREKLAASYPGNAHATRWASNWVFKFPEYDPSIRAHDVPTVSKALGGMEKIPSNPYLSTVSRTGRYSSA
ncbi:hypothetical protein FHL15_009196 [Xylaria flabelliformis]|uniref:Uncharacterized protein n=1 Tax=Xylaria flabelliformis TaxID=2512241 RepID=A0A553HPN9_9PEZI|nr:hypothetical protein FHL15_009196 [Xylaria flabelliformis]